jgi:flavorubredoxin
MAAVRETNRLPREIAPGVYWLGVCQINDFKGRELHSYNSMFLVVGDEHAACVETGVTAQTDTLLGQLETLFARGIREPRYLFGTHSEMAHAGGVGRFLARCPGATAHGDVTDLHLVYPRFADRFFFADPGDRFDLGGREILVVESVFRDLPHTRWFFDTGSRTLFVGDGFAYAHWHDDGGCGCLAEEVPAIDMAWQIQRYGDRAFHWTHYIDIEPYVARVDELLSELGVEVVAPSHGLPIGNLDATMPAIREGFRGMPFSSGESIPGGGR